MAISRRARIWLIALVIVALLLAIGVWYVGRLLQPERLTALLLDRAGRELGLELRTGAPGDYALRPEPRLLLEGLTATIPGERAPLLRAARAELSLPWSTLRGKTETLTVTRIALEAPDLDLVALRGWLDSRPPSDEPLSIPRLTDGLEITGGTVRDDGWSLAELTLSLPGLRDGEAATLEATARLRLQQRATPFTLTLAVVPAMQGETLVLGDIDLRLQASSPLPNLAAKGELRYGERLALALAGQLDGWPEGWPALPEPLAASSSPLPFTLRYDGAADLSAPTALSLARDETKFDARLVLTRLSDWLDTQPASPLPPLTGTLTAPKLVIEGVELEGVRVELQQDAPPPPEQPKNAEKAENQAPLPPGR